MRIKTCLPRVALLAFLVALTGLAPGCLVINIEKKDSPQPPANAKEINVNETSGHH